jgi:hypothetical protein
MSASERQYINPAQTVNNLTLEDSTGDIAQAMKNPIPYRDGVLLVLNIAPN